MAKLFKYSFILLLFSLIMVSCTTKPNFPLEPHIEFVSISKNVINEFDTFSIILSFEDGDGNLGKYPGTSASCGTNVCDFISDTSCFKDAFYGAFLIDMRDSCFAQFDLPDFEPDGNVKAVSGELKLVSPPIFCKNGSCTTCTEDTLVYQVVVKDADNNYSNTVLTDTIYIHCN